MNIDYKTNFKQGLDWCIFEYKNLPNKIIRFYINFDSKYIKRYIKRIYYVYYSTFEVKF